MPVYAWLGSCVIYLFFSAMSHDKIDEVIDQLKGTIYIPSEGLASSTKQLAPSKLEPNDHFILKAFALGYIENILEKWKTG